MVDLPKLELSKLDLPRQWERISADWAARGHDIADELAKRVKQESRSFACREQTLEHSARDWLASPAGRVAGAAVLGFVAGVAASGARKMAMQGSEALAGDWMAVLKAEHRLAEGLFEALLKTNARQKTRRAALFAKLSHALNKHALQEEMVVYPALKETHVDGMAKHLYADHADMKIMLHELAEMSKGDPAWIEKLGALQACVAHHVSEEETDVFPRFHGKLSPQQNTKLTLLMHREGLKLA
jgi:hemerythrin superfamily protein